MMGTHRTDPSGEFGHIGCQYRDYGEFLQRAAEFISVGVNLGQRIVYVGDDAPGTLRSGLAAAGLGSTASTVDVKTVPEHFLFQPGGDVVDAAGMAERYAAAAVGAVADGYSGLRVVIDVTPVARTPAQQEAQAALEFLGDRRISTLPIAAMCGFDVTELGDAAAGLLCLHPTADDGAVPFQLYTEPSRHNAVALAGDLDAAGEELFTTTLGRILPLLSTGTVHIDARELEFVAPRQLCLLDRYCARLDRTVVLRSERDIIRRMVGLLGLSNVRIEAAVGAT